MELRGEEGDDEAEVGEQLGKGGGKAVRRHQQQLTHSAHLLHLHQLG